MPAARAPLVVMACQLGLYKAIGRQIVYVDRTVVRRVRTRICPWFAMEPPRAAATAPNSITPNTAIEVLEATDALASAAFLAA